MEEARGGVCFIDEAYEMCRGGYGGEADGSWSDQKALEEELKNLQTQISSKARKSLGDEGMRDEGSVGEEAGLPTMWSRRDDFFLTDPQARGRRLRRG
eukprot:GHVU01150305.1.p2 GENE.GHVU01150305.1~~GHVU01150305.1.p2  ORF type:complete len:106 (+),score=22.79 GHVU01150305.1:27-320(+)